MSGPKAEIISRLLEHQEKTPAELEDLELSCGSVEDLAVILDLGKETVDALKKDRFLKVESILTITKKDFDQIKGIPLRDRKCLLEYIKDSCGNTCDDPSILEIPPNSNDTRKVVTPQKDFLPRQQVPVVLQPSKPEHPEVQTDFQHHTIAKSRSRIHSHGELDLRELLDKKETTLSRLARALPRPHTFVYSRAQAESHKKVRPLDLQYDEFINGCQALISRLSLLPDHGATLQEYAEYVKFLSAKRRDYQPLAVLQFDDNFRRFADFNGCALNDFGACSNLIHQHFHAGSLLSLGGYPRSFRNGPKPHSFRGRGRGGNHHGQYGFRGASQSPVALSQRPVRYSCWKWNEGSCNLAEDDCWYPHVCRSCFQPGHTYYHCEKGKGSRGGKNGSQQPF